jgi:hypothetical protein
MLWGLAARLVLNPVAAVVTGRLWHSCRSSGPHEMGNRHGAFGSLLGLGSRSLAVKV